MSAASDREAFLALVQRVTPDQIKVIGKMLEQLKQEHQEAVARQREGSDDPEGAGTGR